MSDGTCRFYCSPGLPGYKGITGSPGPQGKVIPTNYMTTRIDTSTTVNPGENVILGNTIIQNGSTIQHTVNTPTIALNGGQTYQLIFSINGMVETGGSQGLVFQLEADSSATNIRVTSQNVFTPNQYNSGTATGYLIVLPGSPINLSIKNIGYDTISHVNGNISVLQITNNS